jgi:SAM-dependent methyltransferase
MYQDPTDANCYHQQYAANSVGSALWSVEQILFDRLLQRWSPDHSSASALDFACGTGRILGFLKPRVGSLVGVDISPAMLEIAAKTVPDVNLICANILEHPEDVPSNLDIITAFRFLLLAEPELRLACIKALVARLRSADSIMILNTHGNPHSFRALASLRNRIFRYGRDPLPSLSFKQLHSFADQCGLRIVDATGCGFIPMFLARRLPLSVYGAIERAIASVPIFWRFATIILVVLKRK